MSVIYDPINDTYLVSNDTIDGYADNNDWWNFTTTEHRTWWQIEEREASDWWKLADYESADQGLWIEGQTRTLPIQWLYFKDYIPLDTNREVTDFVFEPQTLGHEGGGHFDVFFLNRSLLFDKLYGTYVTHICLEELAVGDLPFEIPLFGSVKDGLWCEIKSVDILPLESTTLGANERVMFRVHNMDTGGTVCTRTLMNGDDLVKGRTMRFSTPTLAHAFVEYSYGLYLHVETPETFDAVGIPRCLIVIQWDIAELEGS